MDRGEKIRNKDAVARLAKILGINCGGNCNPGCPYTCAETAVMIADAVLADLRRPIDEKMELIEKIAMPERLSVWGKGEHSAFCKASGRKGHPHRRLYLRWSGELRSDDHGCRGTGRPRT